MGKPNSRRQGLLARVHILRKELGMDEDSYRAALYDNFRVRSAGVLNDAELATFADGLARMLPDKSDQRRPHPGRPHNIEGGADGNSRSAQLRKIEAYLAEAGRPWSYADALAQRICKVPRVAWVQDGELYKIITALEKDARRHDRYRG